MALMTLDIHFKFVVLYCVCMCMYVFDCIVCLPLTLKGYIVRPVKRDWAVLSKDTPLDITI